MDTERPLGNLDDLPSIIPAISDDPRVFMSASSRFLLVTQAEPPRKRATSAALPQQLLTRAAAAALGLLQSLR